MAAEAWTCAEAVICRVFNSMSRASVSVCDFFSPAITLLTVAPLTYVFCMCLRRHNLAAPTLALWPTEVHVVVRRKLCKKGCYFGGIPPPSGNM